MTEATTTLTRAGFIPARAGNTIPSSAAGSRRSVHPRSRGEHLGQHVLRIDEGGSSPLARGTPDHHVCPALRRRFIPARAGNTSTSQSTVKSISVHPRSRGEHVSSIILATFHAGSSPLARGTLPYDTLEYDGLRFIPARAGNTLPRRLLSRSVPVHPRSRGEHLTRRGAAVYIVGSSPLARGTHFPQTNVIKELLRYRYFYRPERPLRLHYWRAIRA